MTQVRIQANANAGRNALTATSGALVLDAAQAGCLLAFGTTYYFPIGDGDSTTKCAQVAWDNSISCTLTIEATNFLIGHPSSGGPGTSDTSDYTVTPGLSGWVPWNPTGVYVPIINGVATAFSVAVTAAGGAGGCIFNVADAGPRRFRVKAVVTAAGALRVVPHGKY